MHAKKIEPSQRLRFLVLTKRSVALGDENVVALVSVVAVSTKLNPVRTKVNPPCIKTISDCHFRSWVLLGRETWVDTVS